MVQISKTVAVQPPCKLPSRLQSLMISGWFSRSSGIQNLKKGQDVVKLHSRSSATVKRKVVVPCGSADADWRVRWLLPTNQNLYSQQEREWYLKRCAPQPLETLAKYLAEAALTKCTQREIGNQPGKCNKELSDLAALEMCDNQEANYSCLWA